MTLSVIPLIPRKLLLGNPTRLAPQLSPDGRVLAWLAPVDDVMNIWVAPVDAEAIARLDPGGLHAGQAVACGAHAPDSNPRKTLYVVPVGILDENPELLVGRHIFSAPRSTGM